MGGSRPPRIVSSLSPKPRRRQPVAAAKRLGEVRRLAEANQPGNVADWDCWLLDQQLRSHAQPATQQILTECHIPELRVRSADLTG